MKIEFFIKLAFFVSNFLILILRFFSPFFLTIDTRDQKQGHLVAQARSEL